MLYWTSFNIVTCFLFVPSPSPTLTPSLLTPSTLIVTTNINNNQITFSNGGFTVQNTAGAVTPTSSDCSPQSATIVLGPSPMQRGGARILAALDPCVLTDGTVVFNLPDEQDTASSRKHSRSPNDTISGSSNEENSSYNARTDTVYSGLGQITGPDPATGNPVTLNGNINALFLWNGGQNVELSGDNSAALSAILYS
jgi:hypothetical protein